MTITTNRKMQEALRALIANDSYAMTFQTMAQYRAALLKHVDGLLDDPRPMSQAHPGSGTPSMADYDNTAQQYAALAHRAQPEGDAPQADIKEVRYLLTNALPALDREYRSLAHEVRQYLAKKPAAQQAAAPIAHAIAGQSIGQGDSAPGTPEAPGEYRTCCDHPDCTICAGLGGFYRMASKGGA